MNVECEIIDILNVKYNKIILLHQESSQHIKDMKFNYSINSFHDLLFGNVELQFYFSYFLFSKVKGMVRIRHNDLFFIGSECTLDIYSDKYIGISEFYQKESMEIIGEIRISIKIYNQQRENLEFNTLQIHKKKLSYNDKEKFILKFCNDFNMFPYNHNKKVENSKMNTMFLSSLMNLENIEIYKSHILNFWKIFKYMAKGSIHCHFMFWIGLLKLEEFNYSFYRFNLLEECDVNDQKTIYGQELKTYLNYKSLNKQKRSRSTCGYEDLVRENNRNQFYQTIASQSILLRALNIDMKCKCIYNTPSDSLQNTQNYCTINKFKYEEFQNEFSVESSSFKQKHRFSHREDDSETKKNESSYSESVNSLSDDYNDNSTVCTNDLFYTQGEGFIYDDKFSLKNTQYNSHWYEYYLKKYYFSLATYSHFIYMKFVSKRRTVVEKVTREERRILEILDLDKKDLLLIRLDYYKTETPHIVFYNQEEDEIVVSFRGTQTHMDAFNDLECEYVRFMEGYGHSGFIKLAHYFLEKHMFDILCLCIEKNTIKILLTGQSLGGALATLIYMILLKKTSYSKYKLRVISFSSPPIVSINLCNDQNLDIINIIYGFDLIPRLCFGSLIDLKYLSISLKKMISLNKENIHTNIKMIKNHLKKRLGYPKLYIPGKIFHIYKLREMKSNTLFSIFKKGAPFTLFTEEKTCFYYDHIVIHRKMFLHHTFPAMISALEHGMKERE